MVIGQEGGKGVDSICELIRAAAVMLGATLLNRRSERASVG